MFLVFRYFFLEEKYSLLFIPIWKKKLPVSTIRYVGGQVYQSTDLPKRVSAF